MVPVSELLELYCTLRSRGDVVEMQILIQPLRRGQLRFWISKWPGDADEPGPPTGDSKTLSRAGGRMLNNNVNLVQWSKVCGKTRKASDTGHILDLFPCFISVPALCIYLAGMKHHHQQWKTKTHCYPKSICLLSKNTPPTETLFEFCEAVKAVVTYKQTPRKKDGYRNSRWWGNVSREESESLC